MENSKVVNRFLAVFFILLTVGVVVASIYYKSYQPLIAYGGVVIFCLGTMVLYSLIFLPLMAITAKLFGGKATDENNNKNEENEDTNQSLQGTGETPRP